MRLGTSLSLADPLLQSRKLKTLLQRVGNVDAEIIPVGGALSLSLTTDRLTDSSTDVFNNTSLLLDFVPHDPQQDRSLQFASSMDALKGDNLLLDHLT